MLAKSSLVVLALFGSLADCVHPGWHHGHKQGGGGGGGGGAGGSPAPAPAPVSSAPSPSPSSAPSATDPVPEQPQTYNCGEVNILFTGLPAYHPLVGAQGFNQTAVDLALYNISNAIVQAGYNLKIAFLGPERPLSDLEQSITEEYGVNFDGAIIGAGIRASVVPQLIVQFEDMLETIGTLIPDVRFLFNGNVESTLPAIQRVFPINETCTTPGKAYGFNVYCDPQVCTNATASA